MAYRCTTNPTPWRRKDELSSVETLLAMSRGKLSLDGNPQHFIFSVAQQTAGPHKRARRIVLVKVSLINVIERLVVLQIAAEYLYGNDVVHRQSSLLYGGLYALHDELRFLLRIRRCLPCLGIEPDVPRNVERVADQNAIAERQSFGVCRPRLDNVFPVGGPGNSTRDQQHESNCELA